MSCRQFRSRVVAFADGELSLDEAERMREHAAKCPACAAELAAVKRESEIYGAAMREAASPGDLADAVMSRIENVHILISPSRAGGQRGIPVKWVISMAGAAAAVLLVLVWAASLSLRTEDLTEEGRYGWRVIPAIQTAPIAQYRLSSSIGRDYADTADDVDSSRSARTPALATLVSSEEPPLHQVAPLFEVQEHRSTGEAEAMNKELGHPPALSLAEQQAMNVPDGPGVPEGADARGSKASAPIFRWRPEGATQPTTAPVSALPSGPSAVVVEATDARVVLAVSYARQADRYLTLYEADFAADYVVRAPDTKGGAVRIVLSFPFPQGCDTVSGAQLLVDGKPDDEHTTYRITGIRWVNWFKPRQVKRISVGYKAWGQGNYRYVLDRVNLTRRLRFLMRIEGTARGHQVDFPPDALPPVRAPSDIPGCWDYLWDYSRLVSNRDIAVNFPTRESPSVAAGHVMRTVGNYLFVARLAPIFLAVFAGALMWGGPLNRGRAPNIEELALLGLAFLLFYPLFLFGASYVGRDAALIGALAVVVTLSATFAARVHGPTMAGRVVVLQLVLLGAFTYAMFDRALTGLIFTVGATLLVAYFMLARGRKMPPTPGDATSLLQPNTPHGVTSVADQDREA